MAAQAPPFTRQEASLTPLLLRPGGVETRGHYRIFRGRLGQHLACRSVIRRLGAGIAVEAVVDVLGNGDVAGLRNLYPDVCAVPLAIDEGRKRAGRTLR